MEKENMTAAELAKYIYEGKPITLEKDYPIYWEAKTRTKGMSGAMETMPPLRFAQKYGGRHYIYGIGWMWYKDKNGTIKTIYTDAIAPNANSVKKESITVTKSGS